MVVVFPMPVRHSSAKQLVQRFMKGPLEPKWQTLEVIEKLSGGGVSLKIKIDSKYIRNLVSFL